MATRGAVLRCFRRGMGNSLLVSESSRQATILVEVRRAEQSVERVVARTISERSGALVIAPSTVGYGQEQALRRSGGADRVPSGDCGLVIFREQHRFSSGAEACRVSL